MMRAFPVFAGVLSFCLTSTVFAQSAAGIRRRAGGVESRGTGPMKTIAAQQAAFDQMLASIQAE